MKYTILLKKFLVAALLVLGNNCFAQLTPLTIGTIPKGDSIIVVHAVTITGSSNVSNQGTISGSNFASVLTNDPKTATANDATMTTVSAANPNLTINDVSLNEGNAGATSFTFTVNLSAPAPAGGVTFDIATADGTATQPSDYTQKSLTGQTIPAGSSTYSFTVLVNGDVTSETNETFFVNVTNAANATVTDGQGQGTIVNDDAAPNLTINDVTLNEGNAGTTTFTFTVSLSAPAPAGGVTFDIATVDGTATQPSDYTQKSLTAQTIPAGSLNYTFDVLVSGDVTVEPNETFFVNVTNAANAIVTDGQGQGTITNDDASPLPNLTINDVTLNEGNAGTTTFTFTLSLSAPAPAGGVTFDIATADGAATIANNDYVARSLTTQTIAAGNTTYTFDVTVNGDVTVEPNETFTVNVTNVTGANVTDGQGQGTITNDDGAPSVITYYPKTSATDLSQASNWTDDVNGTAGTSPLNFTSPNQLFSITRNPAVLGAWTISGGSNVILSVTGLTFNPTSSLTVGTGSDFNFGGNNNYSTTFKSIQTNTAYFGQLNGTISNATNVTVERFISSQNNRAYRLLSPSVNTTGSSKPFIRDNWQEGTNNPNTSTNNNPATTYGTHITGSASGTNGFDATASGQGSLFTYTNTPAAYVPAINTSSSNLNAKIGYLLYIRGDRSIDLSSTTSPLPSTHTTLRATGTLLQGLQTYSSLASNDFSLVTNPYASAINWSSIYTNNSGSFANYYTYWDPNIASRGGYVTVRNDGTQNPNMTPVPPVFPGVNIQSGQAFFVLSTTASPTFTIREIDKSTTNNIDVFRTTTPATQKFTTSLFYNDAEHGRRLADGVTSLYDDSYTKAIDGNDAEEINNWDENIAIARAGKRLSIEERPTITAKDTLALFMNNMKQQSYEFEFIPSGLNPNTIAILTDNYTGGKTYLDVTAKTVVPFSVTSATASSASDRFYIIFSPGGALPVTITSVKAYQKNTGVQTEWTTQQENNIDRYEVERSQNGQQFTKLGAVNATGNTSNVSNYNLFDANPFSGVNYYRIKIIDKQGQATYSQVVKVNISSKANQITVTPNPVHGNTVMVQMTNMQRGSYTISLTNKLGQVVANKTIDHAGGTTTESITPSKAFAAGVYQLKVTGNSISVTQQVLKD